MGKLTVLDGGMFTTVQDLGRVGFRSIGVPTSGILDAESAIWANRLVGNPDESPVLEFTLKGGSLRFEFEARISITGANMEPEIHSNPVPMNKCLSVQAGDELRIGFAKRGCRAYLAIRGEWELQSVMNSFSTYVPGSFGGYEGRALQADDILSWREYEVDSVIQAIPKEKLRYYSSKITVKIMPGIEWDWLDSNQQKKLLNDSFEVDSKSNRMGIRLSGNPIRIPNKQMVSSPVIPGIVQLPESGNPIILMNDGQTIGGYPRIAKVLDEDLWRLGQVKAGDTVRFKLAEK